MTLSVLSVRVPREAETSPEQTAQLLASLSRATSSPRFFAKLFGHQPVHLSLEITLINSQIFFCVVYPSQLDNFVQSQITATYPQAVIKPTSDYLRSWTGPSQMAIIRQTAPAYFPLRDYADYKTVDPMLPMLGVLARTQDQVLIQFVLSPAGPAVATQANRYITPTFEASPEGKSVRELPPEEKQIIKDKLSHPLVNVSVRFAANRAETITDLMGAISVLNRPDGNSLAQAKTWLWSKNYLWSKVLTRQPTDPQMTLNVMELASLWHLPGAQTQLPNIAWSASVAASEAPDNLPTTDKDNISFFAQTQMRNQPVKFGLTTPDRLHHMYILGKTGSGKSTLLENMAIDDCKKGRGIAFIDPHGDSVENLINYIPKYRINSTIYFNPADVGHPITINILEVDNPDQAELVVSGIIAIFHKLYGKFWGPRMQYILRNALLTLTSVPGSTLPDVIKILSDFRFRSALYPRLTNKSLLHFWQHEFDRLEEKTRLEYTYPILNKIGQFVNSPLIQGLISQPKSSIKIGQIMDKGQILLANLSQGKLGEDNAALLGAMLITKFELAAMSRIDQPARDRRDFFLYVDEFQNFATESFTKVLSEARKFHLGLILANQYIAQVPETIQNAIFGNVGTLVSFVLGAEDARIMAKEFSPVFDENSLVNLQKYQTALKMTIGGQTSRPFSAFTLPPLKSTNSGKTKVISQSRRRWAHS